MKKPQQIIEAENRIKTLGVNAKHQTAAQTATELTEICDLMLCGIKELGLYSDDDNAEGQQDAEKADEAAAIDEPGNREVDRPQDAGVPSGHITEDGGTAGDGLGLPQN